MRLTTSVTIFFKMEKHLTMGLLCPGDIKQQFLTCPLEMSKKDPLLIFT